MSTLNRVRSGLFTASLLISLLNLNAQDQGKNRRPLFRVGVETVFLKVSVTDSLNRYVTGLEKEHFKVYEDKIEQSISYFGQQSAPISVGIILDVSNSMKDNNNLKKSKNALSRFLESENSDDESFLITFNDKALLAQSFTSNGGSIQNMAAFQKARGSTALYDAVYMGLDQVKRGKNDKKALIVITDGEDNSSRYSLKEVREFAKEADVQIYGIGVQGNIGYGNDALKNIVNITGGRAFFPTNFNDLDYYIDLIHTELRNQYLLGYEPTNKLHDGKWRRISVKLDAPEGFPKLAIHAREGYYAPKE
jgi:Ca-activated chloride channel family protein